MLNEIVNELTAIKKMKIIDFKESFENLKNSSKYFYFIMLFLFVFFAIVNLFLLLKEPNYDEIIRIGEKVAIFLATTTILTFTYALNLSEKNKAKAIESGKYFFQSFLNFIIGMISSIGARKVIINPSNEILFLSLLNDLTIVILFLFFITGFFLLIASGYFFVRGIMSLKF